MGELKLKVGDKVRYVKKENHYVYRRERRLIGKTGTIIEANSNRIEVEFNIGGKKYAKTFWSEEELEKSWLE